MIPRLSQAPSAPDFIQDPYRFYARVHREGGVFFWEEYGHPFLAKYTHINAVLRDRRFGREPLEPPAPDARLRPFQIYEANSMLERENPAHARLRRLVGKAFATAKVARLKPRVAAQAHALIDALEERGEGDLIPAFCEPIPVITIAELFGVPNAMAGDLLAWSHAMVGMYQHGRDRAVEDAAVAATVAFSDYLRAEMAARRDAPRDDLLTHLVRAEAEGDRLTEDEAIATAILILNAGHEASVQAFAIGVKTLLEAGEADRALAPDRVPNTVEELLRFDPPLHVFTRFVLEDMDAFGLSLKRGDVIGLLLGAGGRDPARHEAPDSFDPMRAEPVHVSLSAGAHFCLGAPLARLELATALPILFQRAPKLRMTAPPIFADRYHFRALERLDVAL